MKKVVVIGAGLWGRNLVRVFARLGALGGICDRDEQALQGMVASLTEAGLADGVQALSWEEILADKTLESVVLAVPVRVHFEMTIAALEHGKHVWVEKPMVTSVLEAEKMVEKAEQCGRKVMVNHLMRYHAGVEKLLSMVAEGRLGRIWHVETVRKAPGRVFEDADALYDLMPHDMSVVRALMDVLGARGGLGKPLKIQGLGGSAMKTDKPMKEEALDWAVAHLVCEGGGRIKMEVARLYPEKQQRMVVQATNGMLVFDDRRAWSEKLMYYCHRVDVERQQNVVLSVGDGRAIALIEREPLEEAARHFMSVINGEAELRTPAIDAMEELRLLEEIKQRMQ